MNRHTLRFVGPPSRGGPAPARHAGIVGISLREMGRWTSGRCRALRRLGLAAIVAGMLALPVRAEVQFAEPLSASEDSISSRLAALEHELASLRATREPTLWEEPGGQIPQPVCDQPGGVFAGFAFVWAKPHFKEAFQATSYAVATDTMSLVGYDYSYDLAPRAWLGFERPDGLGFRSGYWHYDHSGSTIRLASDPETVVGAQTITVSLPAIIQSSAPGQLLTADSGLEVQTLDVEGTMRLQIGPTLTVAGAGVRYGRMVQDNQAVITAGEEILAVLSRRRRMEGFGPTLSADMLRPVGSGGLAVAAAVRGALLFGDKSFDRFATGSIPGGVSMDVDDFTFTTDLSVGLQWARPLGAGELALRGAYEGSFWIDAGEPVLTLLGFEGFALSLIVSY